METSTPEVCLDHLAVCRRALRAVRRHGLADGIEPEELIGTAALAIVRERPATEALAFTIARNAILYVLRTESARRKYRGEVEDMAAVAGTGRPLISGPELELWEAVKALPAREYRVVTLHFWGNKTCAEIGEELNVSAPRVSQILSAAKRNIREALNIRQPQALTNIEGKFTESGNGVGQQTRSAAQ